LIVGVTTGDFGYDLLVFAHILLAVIGGGAAFANAIIGARTRAAAGEAQSFGLSLSAAVGQVMVDPTLWVAGGLGIALVIADSDRWDFSQTWISIAFALWLIAGILGSFVLRRAGQQAINAAETGDGEALAASQKQLAMFRGIHHLVLVLLILDMVFKPGV
jgi:hypothetical protein